ncbi:MAG: L-dopachrome tautomerase-related protein, partial [Puniceicoccales bacterium]
MKMHQFKLLQKQNIISVLAITGLVWLTGCQCQQGLCGDSLTLVPVAFSDKQWTGVAVSGNERIFVNYPRWSDEVPVSVAELKNGKPVAFPDAAMNDWAPGKDPATHFVCVQAVYADDANTLWILDPASPKFQGVVPGGAKLVKVDLANNVIERTYFFSPDVATPTSYLNDVRIDNRHGFAYISDSGAGALVVLDLKTGDA